MSSNQAPTPEQLRELREAMHSRREALLAQLAEHRHGETAAERAHEVLTQDADDEPQRIPERDIAAALTDHEQREIAAIDAALLRMKQGGYGECEDCGCVIPLARLRVEPWALRCVPCEEKRERAKI